MNETIDITIEDARYLIEYAVDADMVEYYEQTVFGGTDNLEWNAKQLLQFLSEYYPDNKYRIVDVDSSLEEEDEIIIDSNLTFDQALENTRAPKNVIESLVLLDIEYISLDNKIHRGQIMVNKSVENEVKQFFKLLLQDKFIIEKMIPTTKYDWDDDKSMEDNNTSGFNYRFIANSNKLSNHALGKAIDVNPKWNPVIYSNGKVLPKGGTRDKGRPGTFQKNSRGVTYLISKNWNWGGEYKSFKDWHHFDKD
jgi:hypothetical protein